MFTGLIEAQGKITQIIQRGKQAQITVQTAEIDFAQVALGDSIAVNGVCLTVVDKTTQQFSADVSSETLNCTCLGNYQLGQGVNLEQALLPTTRLGGHLVSGHVDGVGAVSTIQSEGKTLQITIKPPQSLMKYIAAKGSICVDGISLTVNELINQPANEFRLTIVPHSLAKTQISQYKVGTLVNLEVDILARYMERLLSKEPDNAEKSSNKQGITREKLNDLGFD